MRTKGGDYAKETAQLGTGAFHAAFAPAGLSGGGGRGGDRSVRNRCNYSPHGGESVENCGDGPGGLWG